MAQSRRRRKRMQTLGDISVNSGRDVAALIREADPAGRPVTHAKVATQTPLDTYLRRRQITEQEWHVGDRYRAICYIAALEPGMVQTNWHIPVDQGRVVRDGFSERQETARRKIRGAERHIGPTLAAVLRHVIIDRGHAGSWARRRGYRETSGMDFLRDALGLLREYWGML